MPNLLRRLVDWLKGLRQPQPNVTVYEEERPARPETGGQRLSPHFLLSEFTRSSTASLLGIDNTPSFEHVKNLSSLAVTLERVRAILGHPIIISSGYRSPALNRAVGGSATSDHANGLAVDFTCPGFGSPQRICEAIVEAGIPFDQLIYEQGNTEWVHLGIGTRRRHQLMSWSPARGYVPGIQRLT